MKLHWVIGPLVYFPVPGLSLARLIVTIPPLPSSLILWPEFYTGTSKRLMPDIFVELRKWSVAIAVPFRPDEPVPLEVTAVVTKPLEYKTIKIPPEITIGRNARLIDIDLSRVGQVKVISCGIETRGALLVMDRHDDRVRAGIMISERLQVARGYGQQ